MNLDVAIIGGGPAGISAGIELVKKSDFNIGIFNGDDELGGIARSCHYFFGLRDQKRILSGPAYAKRLSGILHNTRARINNNATVVRISPSLNNNWHQIDVVSKEGLQTHECRAILLATGCFESSRSARKIPGTRPAGIFTTGTIQDLIKFDGYKPGDRALIVGSEIIALSCAYTLSRAGISIVALIEEENELQTYPALARVAGSFFKFPLYKDTTLQAIQGERRVESVVLRKRTVTDSFQIGCDMVVITGKLRSYSVLFDNLALEKDLYTHGPVIDTNLMTSIPDIFAAGNVLRGADMHDLCALEGKKAAQAIIERLIAKNAGEETFINIRGEWPVKYVVPQRIIKSKIKYDNSDFFHPGISMYTSKTLKEVVLEGWSGENIIWHRSHSKLIGNYRVPLPIRQFDWNNVDPDKPIIIKIKS